MPNIKLMESGLPVAPLKIGAMESCRELGEKVNDYIVWNGRSDGTAVFHHGNWKRYFTECSQYARFKRSCIHDRRKQDRNVFLLPV